MSGPDRMMPHRRGGGGGVIRGLALLGRGRAEGFECFENSRDAFLAGLSPQVGFLLVAAMLLLARTPTVPMLSLVLLLVCAVLLPPVITQAMARLWRRDDRWRRYATASLWSIWLIAPACLLALLLVSILVAVGVSPSLAVQTAALLVVLYRFWLQWFMARVGLSIGGLKAALTVVALLAGSSLVDLALEPLLEVLQPQLLQVIPGHR